MVRSLRARLGITQEQLAARVGASLLAVKRWERVNGQHPGPRHWKRFRDLWELTRIIKRDEFWKDREVPPNFCD